MSKKSPAPTPDTRPSPFSAIAVRLDALKLSDSDVHATIARLSNAAAADGEYAADLAAIEAAEVEAMRAWAANGDGDPPEPLTDARHQLETKHAALRQRAAAARAALPALQEKVRENNSARKALAREAGVVAFADLQAQFEPAFAELEAAQVRVRTARIAVNALIDAAFSLGRYRHDREADSGSLMLGWASEKSRSLADALAQHDAPRGDANMAFFAEIERGKRAVVERIAVGSCGLINLEGA